MRYSDRASKYVLTCNNNGAAKHFMIQTIRGVRERGRERGREGGRKRERERGRGSERQRVRVMSLFHSRKMEPTSTDSSQEHFLELRIF